MTDVADILRAAADLLEPEGAWTKRAEARDRRGRTVRPVSPDACSWCAGGAIRKVTAGLPDGVRWRARSSLLRHLDIVVWSGVADWNDAQSGPGPVLAVLRAAAEKAS